MSGEAEAGRVGSVRTVGDTWRERGACGFHSGGRRSRRRDLSKGATPRAQLRCARTDQAEARRPRGRGRRVQLPSQVPGVHRGPGRPPAARLGTAETGGECRAQGRRAGILIGFF